MPRTGRVSRLAGLVLCAGLLSAAVAAAQPSSAGRRVLLLHREGFSNPFRSGFDIAFLKVLQSPSDPPIDLYQETIEADRFPGEHQSRLFSHYLTSKYAGHPIDVIVAVGDGALTFARQHRDLFGGPAIVGVASAPGQIEGRDDNVTGLQGGPSFGGTIDLALALRPETRHVYVVYGSREAFWPSEPEFVRLKDRYPSVSLEYLRDLPVTDLQKRLAAVPERSVVLFLRQTMLDQSQDLDAYEGLSAVVKASPVPVFGIYEPYVGRGIVGGYLWRYDVDARRLAEMTKRILNGARVRDVPAGRVTNTAVVDWQQLQRWHISETLVPAESTVLFRQPSFFETHRIVLIVGLVVFVIQLMLIAGLVTERSWRRRAEVDATRTREELAHMARVSAMGELAASIAHELNQPLAAILSNAQAADLLLSPDRHSPHELKEILRDIMSDDRRAADMIARMRELVTKHTPARTPVSVQDVVRSMVNLVRSDAIFKQVTVSLDLAGGSLLVNGDRVQLQQVVLNLLLNALDVTSGVSAEARRIVVSDALSDRSVVHVVVSDNGPGLPEGAERSVFDPFFTTKQGGMGMGLSIARSIVEAHDGKIWARTGDLGGAEFHFKIPLVKAPSARVTGAVDEALAYAAVDRALAGASEQTRPS